MGIRTKLLLSTAIIGILALIATFVVADKIVMSSFSNLEKRETERNWWRASDAINRRVKSMVESSHGWAVSNDAHQFLLGKNPTYSKTKFGNSAIAGMGLDAVFFIKKNRSIAHGKFSKKSLLRNITPQSFLTDIQLPKLNTKKPDPSGGLVRHDGQLLVYSARAVTDSKGKAEPSGWMVWIQHLSPEMIKSLAFELDLQVKISPKVHEFKDLVKLDLIGDSQVSGTGHLLGIDEKPVGSLTVYDKRDIYAVGQSTIQLVHIGIIGLITLAMFGISAGIQRNVISRLFSLNTQLGAVNTVTGEGSIQIPGQDEISKVGESLNTMLTKIADSAAEIEMQKSELVGINENLESIIAERTRKLASMNAVLQYALDGIAELTPSGQVVQANATLAKIFGMDELANVSFIELFSSGEKIWNHIVAHLEYHSRLDMNLDAKTVDGSIIHLQAVFVSEGTEQGGLTAIHVFLKDVTEHKQIEQDMVFQAKHDMLTGLTNRRGFVEALERNLKDTDEPCAILFVDLDNFKYINDSKGHDVGDGLLVEVTKILRQVAPANTTLGRLGGDEFVILAPNISGPDAAIELADRLMRSFEQPLLVKGKEIFITCSLGIAIQDEFVKDASELLRNADTAMYRAKAKGKAGYEVFDGSMSNEVLERVEIETGLRRALERDEFALLYQPLVDLKTGLVVGAESLIRWNHPTMGLVSPVRFVPLAEETGLIVSIGNWILKEAMACAVRINAISERPFRMNINLSQRQMRWPGLFEEVQKCLDESGVDPSLITLEITETLAMESEDIALAVLGQLKQLGVKLAIDDFGTGYSSLSQLQLMPVDKVKIDRSFVHLLGIEDQRTEVVAAILSLCKAMDLEVTGEGIETELQATYLSDMGCHIGQGYLFAKPMSDQALTAMVGTRQETAA